jgi:ribosomal protein L40E
MRKPREDKNCPYCLSPVEPDEERVRCPRCGVVHHADCWKTNGKCSVYGCDGWAVWSSKIAERLAPIPQEAVEVTESAAVAPAQEEVAQCMKCGAPVGKNQLVCRRCRHAAGETHYMENCFGPALLALFGVTAVVALLVKALV